jgi:hypothetical protein
VERKNDEIRKAEGMMDACACACGERVVRDPKFELSLPLVLSTGHLVVLTQYKVFCIESFIRVLLVVIFRIERIIVIVQIVVVTIIVCSHPRKHQRHVSESC